MISVISLREKAAWVRVRTLKIHGLSPATRIASSLSPVDVLTVLFYGGILAFDAANPLWEGRDRFIVSKGHGAIGLYPIFADLGFFPASALDSAGKSGSFLGGIPDATVPGFETTNGSLGHGLGVACGVAMALFAGEKSEHVFVLMGDGELNEGSVWEAVMFAAQHKLGNLTLIVDRNRKCMLGECAGIMDLSPLDAKFAAFGWDVCTVDGHDTDALLPVLAASKDPGRTAPRLVIANTVKGKGVKVLEDDPISHVRTLNAAEVAAALVEVGS